jgi:hypothetical protein
MSDAAALTPTQPYCSLSLWERAGVRASSLEVSTK